MGKRKAPAKRRKKVALVCAGGGVTGAIYEMGCLRGLDELLDKSALDFDLYVGISGDRLAAARSRNDACLAACWDRTDRGRHSDRPFALGPAGHASPDRPGLSHNLGYRTLSTPVAPRHRCAGHPWLLLLSGAATHPGRADRGSLSAGERLQTPAHQASESPDRSEVVPTIPGTFIAETAAASDRRHRGGSHRRWSIP